MVRGVERDGFREKVNSGVVVLGRKGLVALVLECVGLGNILEYEYALSYRTHVAHRRNR